MRHSPSLTARTRLTTIRQNGSTAPTQTPRPCGCVVAHRAAPVESGSRSRMWQGPGVAGTGRSRDRTRQGPEGARQKSRLFWIMAGQSDRLRCAFTLRSRRTVFRLVSGHPLPVRLRPARWPGWSMPSSDTNAHSDAYGLTRKPAKLLTSHHNIDVHPGPDAAGEMSPEAGRTVTAQPSMVAGI
jgi:hypothetical protein